MRFGPVGWRASTPALESARPDEALRRWHARPRGLRPRDPDGAFFGLLGPNGAGKTTAINAVCNLIRITGGEALVFGRAGSHLAARREVGLAEQDINLDRFLTVERRSSTTAATSAWAEPKRARAPTR